MSRDWPLVATIIAILALFAVGLFGSIRAEQEWREFARAQDCKVIGHIAPSTGTGIGPTTGGGASVMLVSIPGKTGYRCNDGKEYWR